MQWYPDLYLGEGSPGQYQRIIRKLKRHKILRHVYVVTIATNPSELLDIYPSWMLAQRYYRHYPLQILGLARSRKDAFELSRKMIEDVYRHTDGFDVRTYFFPSKNSI